MTGKSLRAIWVMQISTGSIEFRRRKRQITWPMLPPNITQTNANHIS